MKLYVAAIVLLLTTVSHAENSKPGSCNTSVARSATVINHILADLDKTYGQPGGGGITNIQQTATNTYLISIAQEERVDQIEYKVSLHKSCEVTILEKTESTITFIK